MRVRVGSGSIISTMSLGIDDISLTVNESTLRQFLNESKYPEGLIEVVSRGLKTVPLRFFIIDDSGSMSETDGNLIAKSGKY